jgi:replication factor A1
MRKTFWGGLGRTRSRGRSASKHRKTLGYLAIIAVKHSIDARDFFNCIVEAWKHQETKCKQVNVRCRERTKDSAIFLFTAGHEVLAQFPIRTEILQGKNELESYVDMVNIRAPPVERAAKPKIKDLKAGMKKVNLKARVLEIPEPNRVYTRYGTEAYVTNALVGDETGTIRMNLWNEQINMVSEGDLIKIENGAVANFRGELQLRIGKYGKITIIRNAEFLAAAKDIKIAHFDKKK